MIEKVLETPCPHCTGELLLQLELGKAKLSANFLDVPVKATAHCSKCGWEWSTGA